MRRRPTRKAVTLTGVGFLVAIVASTAQAGWLFVLSAGVFGIVVVSVVLAPRLSAVEISRSVPERARVGDDVRAGLSVGNAGRRVLPPVVIEDRFAAFDPIVVASERLARGAHAELEIVRTAIRRGAFDKGEVELSSGAPFGLTQSHRAVAVDSHTIVVPNWVDLTSFPLLEPSSSPSDLLHERARTGAGEEYMGVRDYRPGDPPRFVHWRSTARAGHLVVREYQELATSPVAIVVAGRDDGDPPDSCFEALVGAAASVASYALQTGHPVEMIRLSPNRAIEHISNPSRVALLDWLAGALPADQSPEPAVRRAIQLTGRRGTVVLFVPTGGRSGESLLGAVRLVQAAGSRAIVVVGCSSSWGGPEVPDEGALLDELVLGRAPHRIVRKGKDLRACLQA